MPLTVYMYVCVYSTCV